MNTLSPLQAYLSMYEFLGEFYDTVQNDTLGAVLESLRIDRKTKLPVNPAMKADWLATIKMAGLEGNDLTSEQAYGLMAEFLRNMNTLISTTGLDKVISWISLNEHNKAVRLNWEECIARVLEKDED